MEAIPSWAAPFEDCWLEIVRQRWCNDEWLQNSNSCKEHRSLMNAPAHRQGSCSFSRYKMIMEEKRPMSDIAAYYASGQGSKNGTFCNDRAQQVVEKYSEVAKEIHGPDFNVMNAPLDPDVVYKAGCGKKHGRHFIGNGYIDSRVSASQSRSRSRSMSSAAVDDVRLPRRIRTAVDRIGELENQSLQNQNPHVANNGMAATPTQASTPGTAASVGNNIVANVEHPTQENMDETNDDVVM